MYEVDDEATKDEPLVMIELDGEEEKEESIPGECDLTTWTEGTYEHLHSLHPSSTLPLSLSSLRSRSKFFTNAATTGDGGAE